MNPPPPFSANRRYVFCLPERTPAQVIEDKGGSALKVLFPDDKTAHWDRAKVEWEAVGWDAKQAFDRARAQAEHDRDRGELEHRRQMGIPRRDHAEV